MHHNSPQATPRSDSYSGPGWAHRPSLHHVCTGRLSVPGLCGASNDARPRIRPSEEEDTHGPPDPAIICVRNAQVMVPVSATVIFCNIRVETKTVPENGEPCGQDTVSNPHKTAMMIKGKGNKRTLSASEERRALHLHQTPVHTC